MVAPRSSPLVILNFLTLASSRFVLPQRNISEFLLAASTQRLSDYEPEGTASTGPCTAFQLGNVTAQELYSPNYPHNYPNHSDCIRIISAQPGHLLKLDFRDEFNVEPSEECRFDYLEVRDGEHGYSPLIGKFCGHQFPPMLTSSSRYLWLRFRSDENIEYSGFRAVYTSVPRPTANGKEIDLPPCQMSRSGVEGYVNRSDIPVDRVIASVVHNVPLDCMWIITVQDGWKINLMFVKFSLERPNDCESNFIDVFPERTDLPSRLHNFCGSMAEMVSSRGNTLHIRFVAEPKAINSTFEIVFTAFRDRAKDEVCAKGEYDCEDATCISNSLKCNGRANCRFRWDEDDCKSEVSPLGRLLQEEHMVIILIIFFMILTGMISAFIYNCARKLIRDSQLIKEQIQSSFSGRESSLCQKMPVATVLTPISTILPHMGDVISVSCASSAPPSPRLPPCHVPPLQPLDVTRLQLQHMSLDNFARASVETYAVFGKENSPVTADKFMKEVKNNESQTKASQYMFCSVDSLMPPPPPPPPPRVATIFMETDLDFHPALLHKPPPLPLWGHSRSHESIPSRLRCTDVVAPMPTRRMAPDVIEAH